MGKPKMILVVDDDPNLLMFFNDYFKPEGYNAMLTDDPEKAIRTANLVHPDLLIIDLRMPKVDGFGVLASVREKTPEIKTIVVSAYVDTFEDKIIEARVEAVLKKPVSFEELEKIILKLLQVTKAEIQEKIPAEGRPELRVLFVDDEKDITTFLQEAFNEYGFPTDIANSGEEGLKKAKENKYDILITDNSMGDMPGYEMVTKILKEARHKPHVIALSSANLISDLKEKYRKLGVAKFFSKPTGFEEYIAWLESQIPELVRKRGG